MVEVENSASTDVTSESKRSSISRKLSKPGEARAGDAGIRDEMSGEAIVAGKKATDAGGAGDIVTRSESVSSGIAAVGTSVERVKERFSDVNPTGSFLSGDSFAVSQHEA